MGMPLYGGKDDWDTERPKLIGLINSKKSSTTQLNVEELKTLVEVLKQKERNG